MTTLLSMIQTRLCLARLSSIIYTEVSFSMFHTNSQNSEIVFYLYVRNDMNKKIHGSIYMNLQFVISFEASEETYFASELRKNEIRAMK